MNITIYKVTLYESYAIWEQGTGYSLNPWRGDDIYYKGYDDGGITYTLPDGYTLANMRDGQPAIYDSDGEHCDIVPDYDGKPILVSLAGFTSLNQA